MNTSYQHFLSIQPGLEELLIQEIEALFSSFEELKLTHLKREKGGISVKCPLGSSHYLLEHLKTPTKITIEVFQFRATDFPKLYNKLLGFNWSKVLRYPQFKISATCAKSRMIHSDRVIETCTKAINKYYEQNPPSPKQAEKFPIGFYYPIQIRLLDDICTVSIDISRSAQGEEFYKKNIKQKNAKASLRENIAYALLLSNYQEVQTESLIDPMSGAGTIALMSKCHTDKTERVLDFIKIHYDRLKKLSIPSLLNFKSYILNDIDNTHFEFLNQNTKQLDDVSITNLDFPKISLDRPCALYCNLPYGKRVKINKDEFLKKLFKWIKENQQFFHTQCLLAPIEWQKDFKKENYKTQYIFENGGLKVGIYLKQND